MSQTSEAVPVKKTLSRDEMRSKIFAHREKRKKVIVFQGVEIELHQPLLGQILSAQTNEDREAVVIEMLVDHAHVPGTTEKVFEASDAEAFKEMGFDENFLAVNEALEELTGVNFRDKKKPSAGT